MQCVAACCMLFQWVSWQFLPVQCFAGSGGALQSVAMCCRVLQCVAVCCNVLSCVAGCCSVLQWVAWECLPGQCCAGSGSVQIVGTSALCASYLARDLTHSYLTWLILIESKECVSVTVTLRLIEAALVIVDRQVWYLSISSQSCHILWHLECHFNLNLQSQSPISISLVSFHRNVTKRPRKVDYRLRFEIEEMTLQIQ